MTQCQHKEMVGNTSQPSRSRNWCFTLNNYCDEDIYNLTQQKCEYVFQEETGKDGTKHLQGILMYKNAITFESVKNIIPRAHIERTKSKKASIEYCQKEETRTGEVYTNIAKPIIKPDPMKGLEFKDWQNKIIKIISGEPDKRKIHWFYENTGGVGKTTFAKHLVRKYDALYVSGKGADIKFAISTLISKKIEPKIVILNVPRYNKDAVSYQAIEEVKDALFFSGKYESGMIDFEIPHFIVFANEEPDYSKLSEDRWDVEKIR